MSVLAEARKRFTARAILRELCIFGFFAVLALIYTWPLAASLGTRVSDPGDPLLNTWILDWVVHSLTRDPLNLFNAPMFAGAKYPLAFSENLLGIAILVLPFKLLGLTPIAMHSVAILLGFTLSGYGMTVLARTAGASLKASLVAAVSFAFCQYFFDHLPHLQVVSAGWLPLSFAALLRLIRKPTWGSAALFAAAFTMNGLTNVYWLMFGGVTAALTVAFVVAVDPALRNRAFLLRVLVGFAAAGVVLLPVLIPYRIVSAEYGMVRNWSEIGPTSATLDDYFRSNGVSLLHGSVTKTYIGERQLAPGLLPLLLAVATLILAPRRLPTDASDERSRARKARVLTAIDGVIILIGIISYFVASSGPPLEVVSDGQVLLRISRGGALLFLAVVVVLIRLILRVPGASPHREGKTLAVTIFRSRFWPTDAIALFWIVLAGLGSMGSNSVVYGILFTIFEPFRAMRVPARWSVIVFMGLAVLAARGLDLLLARRHGWQRHALFAFIAAFAFADTAVRIVWTDVVTDPVPVYEWLKKEKVEGPIFELPMTGYDVPYTYLLGLAEHKVPLINGTSGFSPPSDLQLLDLSSRNEFNDAFLSILKKQKAQLLVVHVDLLKAQRQAVTEFLEKAQSSGQLVLLRRFDRGPNGDFVFAFTGAPGWQRLKQDGVDAIGMNAREQWQRVAAGQPVYSGIPLLQLSSPKPGEETFRRLLISGWAVAPKGIESVEVRIHDGRLRYEAHREPRPDVSGVYPWYPNDPNAGFKLAVPKRPKGIPKETDVQVVVTDREGRKVHSENRRIRWH